MAFFKTQYLTAGTDTFIVPSGVSVVIATIMGGGGGGANGGNGDLTGAGGGFLLEGHFIVESGQTYNLTIGSGGTGQFALSPIGGFRGGSSIISRAGSLFMRAPGGQGGGSGPGGEPFGKSGLTEWRDSYGGGGSFPPPIPSTLGGGGGAGAHDPTGATFSTTQASQFIITPQGTTGGAFSPTSGGTGGTGALGGSDKIGHDGGLYGGGGGSGQATGGPTANKSGGTGGGGFISLVYSDTVIPPTLDIVSGVSTNQVFLDWTNNEFVQPIVNFEVYRRKLSGGSFDLLATTTSGITATAITETVDDDFEYKIMINTTFGGATSIPVILPLYPSGFTTTSVPFAVDLLDSSWVNNSTYESAIELYHSTDSGSTFTLFQSFASTGTTGYTNSGLTENTFKEYKLRYINGTGVTTIYTSIGTGLTYLDAVFPYSGSSDDINITLNWTNNSAFDTNVEIYRRVLSVPPYVLINTTTGASVNTYIDTGVTYGVTYEYQFKAIKTTVPTNESALTDPLILENILTFQCVPLPDPNSVSESQLLQGLPSFPEVDGIRFISRSDCYLQTPTGQTNGELFVYPIFTNPNLPCCVRSSFYSCYYSFQIERLSKGVLTVVTGASPSIGDEVGIYNGLDYGYYFLTMTPLPISGAGFTVNTNDWLGIWGAQFDAGGNATLTERYERAPNCEYIVSITLEGKNFTVIDPTQVTYIYDENKNVVLSGTGTTFILNNVCDCDQFYIEYYTSGGCAGFYGYRFIDPATKFNLGGIYKMYIAAYPSTGTTYSVVDATYKTLNYSGNDILTVSGFSTTFLWYEIPVSIENRYEQVMKVDARGYWFTENLYVTIPNSPNNWGDVQIVLEDRWIVVFKTNNEQYGVMGYTNGGALATSYKGGTEDSKYNFKFEVDGSYSLMRFITEDYVNNKILI